MVIKFNILNTVYVFSSAYSITSAKNPESWRNIFFFIEKLYAHLIIYDNYYNFVVYIHSLWLPIFNCLSMLLFDNLEFFSYKL